MKVSKQMKKDNYFSLAVFQSEGSSSQIEF